MEPHSALVGATGAVVLDPVPGEDVKLSVGELDRDLHAHLAIGAPEHGAEVIAELQPLASAVEVVADDVEVGDLGPLARLGLPLGFGLLGFAVDCLRSLVDLLAARERSLRLGCHPLVPPLPGAASLSYG
jgi:hypothetical protein